MDLTTSGGPAFPAKLVLLNEKGFATDAECPGLSKREWFAGMALQGLLAYSPGGALQYEAEDAARRAFDLADAMLARSRKAV